MQRRANEWSEEEIEEWTKASEIFFVSYSHWHRYEIENLVKYSHLFPQMESVEKLKTI